MNLAHRQFFRVCFVLLFYLVFSGLTAGMSPPGSSPLASTFPCCFEITTLTMVQSTIYFLAVSLISFESL
jgi:hypothetical protein